MLNYEQKIPTKITAQLRQNSYNALEGKSSASEIEKKKSAEFGVKL